MKRIVLFILALSSVAIAQAPQQENPSGVLPQHQRMSFLLGDWTASGTSRISPKGHFAPFSLKEHGDWVTDGYFLETKTSIKSDLGNVRSVRVMGYNVEDNVYTYNVYNSLGEHIMAIGTLDANTWTWKAEEKLNGVITQARYTFTFVSKNSYTFKEEVQSPDGKWVTVMQGTATRMQ